MSTNPPRGSIRPVGAPDRRKAADLLKKAGEAYRAGRLAAAQELCRKVLAREPRDAMAMQFLGMLQATAGFAKQGEATLRAALALAPELPQAHINLGQVLHRTDRLDEALEHYRRALDARPDYALAHFNVAQVLQQMGRAQEAVASYRAAVAADSAYAAAWLALGTVLEEISDLEAAWEAYERAAAHEATRERAENNLRILHRLWRRHRTEEGRAAEAAPPDAAALDRALALDPGDVVARAARLTLEAPRAPAGAKRVALHLSQDFHFAILKPVFDALAGAHDILFSQDEHAIRTFDPDVVVVAESQSAILRASMPRARFVWVRHGLISKTTTWFAARVADYACMTSPASQASYERRGGRPRRAFWVTGYTQMDPLFRHAVAARAGAGKSVLYAPTWTPLLSSAEMLGADAVRLIRGDDTGIAIVIKPHPVTKLHRPDWIDQWREIAAREPNVRLVDDPRADIVPLMMAADAMVSDVSSAVFQYLALDRPIVLLTHPQHTRSTHYDPHGIEWRWRDVGEEVRDVRRLQRAVARALDDPAAGAERRAHYRSELFGELTDGRAGGRVAAHIGALEP